MANPGDIAHLSVADRVDRLRKAAESSFSFNLVISQLKRTPKQAQGFHICHMYLHNLFWVQGKKIRPVHYSPTDQRTIAWDYLQDPTVRWELIDAEDFLRAADGKPVRRQPGSRQWLLGHKPDKHATALSMSRYLRRHHVAKQAAPGLNGCGEPCKCGGHASRHITGDACDLDGLEELGKKIYASAPNIYREPNDALDKYLAIYGLYRPMAHNPDQWREVWHVEAIKVPQQSTPPHKVRHHHHHHHRHGC